MDQNKIKEWRWLFIKKLKKLSISFYLAFIRKKGEQCASSQVKKKNKMKKNPKSSLKTPLKKLSSSYSVATQPWVRHQSPCDTNKGCSKKPTNQL